MSNARELAELSGSYGTGGSVGMKNRIINGAMSVAQRGTSGANGGYTVDRWIVAAAGTAGTWAQATGTFTNGQTGNFLQINGAAGNTFVLPVQRIESLNSRDLAGQTATASYEIYQNTGSAMSVTTSLYYANATDNFSATTLIANSSVQSVPSGVVTKVTATFSVPSAATTGIELRPCSQLQALGAGQSIQIGNVQLEKGSTATSFDYRPYGTELALCERYYELCTGAHYNSSVTNGQYYGGGVNFRASKRATPTVTRVADTALAGNNGFPYAEAINVQGFRSMCRAGSTSVDWSTIYKAECEL